MTLLLPRSLSSFLGPSERLRHRSFHEPRIANAAESDDLLAAWLDYIKAVQDYVPTDQKASLATIYVSVDMFSFLVLCSAICFFLTALMGLVDWRVEKLGKHACLPNS